MMKKSCAVLIMALVTLYLTAQDYDQQIADYTAALKLHPSNEDYAEALQEAQNRKAGR